MHLLQPESLVVLWGILESKNEARCFPKPALKQCALPRARPLPAIIPHGASSDAACEDLSTNSLLRHVPAIDYDDGRGPAQ